MQHLQKDITTRLLSDDEDDQEDAEEMQAIHSQLAAIASQLFPPSVTDEPTTLYHRDLSTNNTLINAQGNLVGIVDWECLIAAPTWLSYSLPQFLEGLSIAIADVPVIECQDQDDVESSEERVLTYETAQLRRFFLEDMARVEPQWVQRFNEGRMKRDVLVAIECVENDMWWSRIRGWASAVAESREPRTSLTDAMRNGA
jgi:hypothetical protein